jgi:hypothetical protein
MILAAGSIWFAYRGRRWLSRKSRLVWSWIRQHTLPGNSDQPSVAVYRRLESALQSAFDLRRLPQQTAWEFAGIAQRRLAQHSETQAWSDLPRQVADYYYRVRFGTELPSHAEIAQLEGRIQALLDAAHD